jgi:site-specific DNA recombinase
MSPSYSTKKGVRYRFYVSAALLRGRKAEAGSLTRISATELEAAVLQAVRVECDRPDPAVTPDAELIEIHVERVVVSKKSVTIVLSPQLGLQNLTLPWIHTANGSTPLHRADDSIEADPILVHAVARSHSRIRDLADGRFDTVEALAASAKAHPKMLRQELRLAFLAPDILAAILQGDQPAGLTLTAMLPTLSLSWAAQRRTIGL